MSKELLDKAADVQAGLNANVKLLAGHIKGLMNKLDLTEIEFSNGNLSLFTNSTSAGSYETLFLNSDALYCENSGDLLSGVGTGGYYVHGDYNHWCSYCSNEEAEFLIENFEDILSAFNDKITNQAELAKKAEALFDKHSD